jgi:hypothetical protein
VEEENRGSHGQEMGLRATGGGGGGGDDDESYIVTVILHINDTDILQLQYTQHPTDCSP